MERAATTPPSSGAGHTPPGTTRRRAACVASWALALAVAVESGVHYLRHPLADLNVYLLAVTAWVHGGSLYAVHATERAGFTYPPFGGLALFPLAWIPEPAARVAWTLLTFAAVAAVALIVARALPERPRPGRGHTDREAAAWPLLVALVLASRPLQSNLRFGQVSIFLALAVVADVIALDGRRWQGVLTGLCAAIKLTPLVFIPYLWLIGRRRAAAVAGACFALATGLGALAAPGASYDYWTRVVFHESGGLPLAEGGNQSLYAVLLRAGVHGAPLGTGWVLASLAVGALGLWRARNAWEAGQPLLSLAMAGCVAILVSPISWTHHQGWILLAAAGVFTATGWLQLVILAAIAVPMTIGLPGVHTLGGPGRWLAGNAGAGLALLIACALPFRRLSRQPAGPTRTGGGSPGPP